MSAQRSFTPPSPGSWMIDATHCQRPRSLWMNELFEECYAPGFRKTFARYGALVDTIEYRAIEGFPYICVRPLGAPPDAKGPPPRLLLALLLRLVPALRRRRARAAEVLAEKTWRADRDEFFQKLVPEFEKRLRSFTDEDVGALDNRKLGDHIARLRATVVELLQDHFARTACTMLPVGDFVAHVAEWTGASPREALELLRGSSPESISAVADVDRVAAALNEAPDLRAEVEHEHDAAQILEKLRAAQGSVGVAVSEWLARQGERLVGGHELTDRRAIEVPATLIATLRARLAGSRPQTPPDPEKLRARVPAQFRAEFDTLLAEARSVYGLRDARMALDWWALGLVRRAFMEAGARLVRSGVLTSPEHTVDLSAKEIVAALEGTITIDKREIAARAAWRETATIADAPPFVGTPPSKPPPSDWIPGAAGRVARAFNLYVGMLNESAETDARSLKGLGASPGKYVGPARIVRTAMDFDRVRPGDVLIAPITSPTYNVVLPLLGAIVTDRGGLLSHPAIISREYGIPAVVGARGATSEIREGARVEVDGESGVVRVVA